MTQSQRSVLSAVAEFIAIDGYSPSLREIGLAVGVRSTATVKHHLDALARQGLIAWTPGKARTIRLLRQDEIA